MALASEDEWETDPELKQMRRESVASFEERRKSLVGASPEEAAFVAHKLAGAAETYGFPTLTRARAAFEDWCEFAPAADPGRPAMTALFAELLSAMLKRAEALGKDPQECVADPRLSKLEAAANAVRPSLPD